MIRGIEGAKQVLRRRDIRVALMVAIGVALLYRVDRGLLIRSLAEVRPEILALMLAVNVLLVLLSAWRWSMIGAGAGVRAPISAFVRTTWMSWAVAECGPSLVVGEWARYGAMRRYAQPAELALSQLVDRCSAYLALILLALASALWRLRIGGDASWIESALILVAVVVLGLGIAATLLRRFHTALKRSSSLAKLRSLILQPAHYRLSLATNGLFAANFALAALALDLGSKGWQVLSVAPLVLLGAGSLPSLVSDWGKREAAAALVLTEIGLGFEQSLAVSFVYGAMNLVSALPGLLALSYLRDESSADSA